MPASMSRPGHRRLFAALTLTLAVAAAGIHAVGAESICDTGSGGGGSPPPTASPTGSATPTPTVSLPLIGGSAASRERAAVPGDEGLNPGGTCDSGIGLSAAPASGGVWGTTFALTGALSCNGNVLSDKPVVLEKKSGSSWVKVADGTTSQDGAGYSFTQKPSHNTVYRVRFAGDQLCKAATSSERTTVVRPGVAFNAASGASSKRGGTAVFSGSVLPAHPGHTVSLQVLQGGAWRNAVAATLDSKSAYRLSYTRKSGSGPLLFRVAYFTQHADHGWNVSRNIKVTWS